MKKIFYSLVFILSLTSQIISQPDTITVFHVNDSHSTLEAIGPRDNNYHGTMGGISRIATLVGLTRMTESNVLFLHAGDISIGDIFFNRNFHVPELQLLNSLGLDAMTLGNHEFDLGPEVLLGSLQYAFPNSMDAFPLLSANSDFSDPSINGLQNYVYPYVTKQFGSTKVGIFGLTTPATNLLSNPSPVIISDDIATIAFNTVQTLRTTELCDVVILLSHLGVALDQQIAENIPGIDLIVGGHDHYKYETPITVTNLYGGTTWIVQARSNYMYAGKLKLVNTGSAIQLIDYQLIPVDVNIPQEPTVQAAVDAMITDIETFYGIPFYTQPMGYALSYFEEEATNLLNLGPHDTPAGNLVAEAFRAFTGTDIAIQAGGSIALPLWEGIFTPSDIFRINGYGFNTVNTLGFQLVTFNMTGAALIAGLEFGLSEIEMSDEFMIQCSGIEYTYDGTKPQGSRVVSVKINNQPLNPNTVYSITANEMVIGILNYLQIPYSDLNVLSGVTEFQAVTQYVMNQGNVLVPKELGRILNVGDRLSKSSILGAGFMNVTIPELPSLQMQNVKLLFEFHGWDRGLNYNPNGRVNLSIPKLGMLFRSSTIDWILVENNNAYLRGSGKINFQGNYGYLLLANNNPDKLRVIIWDKNNNDRIVFDNLNMQSVTGMISFGNSLLFAKEESEESKTVNDFVLEQNYPNPFNPSTKISWQSPVDGWQTLKIYDVLGNEVATLVNEYRTAGRYEVEFDAIESGLSSGIYFYQLKIGSFIKTKSMNYVK
ncbi:MAG: 5'-nucleotidase C-terminal domain-containing protein [Ignavibacterium album]|uniref:5'-nucleotidase C-terminal domain-containing protein n=1 Tax=Ignavibacterium album TaxID=591197 RepID=UPI0026F26955|nr:5'-nucleotidase C-terminal domain-containing protein [Ignavibacterium album]MCX8106230.1 5'-nucleotidase C-terminal domain-containing protein [Ignavibacterium album]